MNLVASKTDLNEPLLIGCGIFRREINQLIKKKNWLIKTDFLDSTLHIDFHILKKNLCSELEKHTCSNKIVFYGECHPQMDDILQHAKTFRTEGQNCVEILLGYSLFTKELAMGAFFLFEDWANRWRIIFKKVFGDNRDIVMQIFHEDRKYILAVRTPYSGNFTKEAEEIAQYVDLPLKWLAVDLDNLETVLLSSINQIGAKSDER